uniref:Uncharacterized protein n=1 Tax=Anguilla anguilla TaxID=7936 RepID=A0A0E9T242_ANGAN
MHFGNVDTFFVAMLCTFTVILLDF